MAETTRQRDARIAARLFVCPWCGEKKTLAQMRDPSSNRGRGPNACWACRSTNPGLAWCTYHAEAHPKERFTARHVGKIGLHADCREAAEQMKSATRNGPDRLCPGCDTLRPSWWFRGGRYKSVICRDCMVGHPGVRWCIEHRTWLPETSFFRAGKDGKWTATRCNPCRAARSHGTTVVTILEMQGSTHPECAACGATEALKVDHDHKCCPTERSCGRCAWLPLPRVQYRGGASPHV